MWMMSWPEAMGWGFWVIFEKKQWVEIWTKAKGVDFQIWASPGQLGLRDAPRVVGSDVTVSIVKIMSLSPRVENLKVKKVIKVSNLNYRESSVFRVCFGIPTHVNISCICIFYITTSGYVTDSVIHCNFK